MIASGSLKILEGLQIFEGYWTPDSPISFEWSARCRDDPLYSEILNLKHNNLIHNNHHSYDNLNKNQLLYRPQSVISDSMDRFTRTLKGILPPEP